MQLTTGLIYGLELSTVVAVIIWKCCAIWSFPSSQRISTLRVT